MKRFVLIVSYIQGMNVAVRAFFAGLVMGSLLEYRRRSQDVLRAYGAGLEHGWADATMLKGGSGIRHLRGVDDGIRKR